MNDQLKKTLDALIVAEKEMANLEGVLERLEGVHLATYDETSQAGWFRKNISGMRTSITAMLEKRERAALGKYVVCTCDPEKPYNPCPVHHYSTAR